MILELRTLLPIILAVQLGMPALSPSSSGYTQDKSISGPIYQGALAEIKHVHGTMATVGNMLGVGSMDKYFYLIDLDNRKLLQKFKHDYYPLGGKISSDGKVLATYEYKPKDDKRYRDFHGANKDNKPIRKGMWDDAGGGSVSKNIYLWDVKTGKLIRRLTIDSTPYHMCLLSSGQKLITGADSDRSLKVFETQTGKLSMTFKGLANSGTFLCISPDDKVIACSQTRFVTIVDLQQGKVIKTFSAHDEPTHEVQWLAFSDDGKRLLTRLWRSANKSGPRSCIKIWETDGYKLALDFPDHDCVHFGSGPDGGFSPGGRMVMTGKDQSLILSEMSSGKEKSRVKFADLWAQFDTSPDGFWISHDWKNLWTYRYDKERRMVLSKRDFSTQN